MNVPLPNIVRKTHVSVFISSESLDPKFKNDRQFQKATHESYMYSSVGNISNYSQTSLCGHLY